MKNKILLALRIIAAVILLQTLYFKFTGAAESIYIFKTVGMEPWGRYGSGFTELIASILLLIPATQVFGALIAVGVMAGAILSHLTILGLTIPNADGNGNDGGLLFALAVIVFVCGSVIVVLQKETLLGLYGKFTHKRA